jgi:anti-sigma factor RsiW
MDCRQFLRAHTAFLDDTLSGEDTARARDHVLECPACAAHDLRLRRAMMLARSASAIVPSEGFSERLAARIAAERAMPPSVFSQPRWRRRATTAAAVVVLVAVGGWVAAMSAPRNQREAAFALSPIVVRPPAVPVEPVAAPAMFATVTSGFPVFPAVLLAKRASEQFAATHARTVSFQATQ